NNLSDFGRRNIKFFSKKMICAGNLFSIELWSRFVPRCPSNVFPSHAYLLEVCHYDPLTGIFTRKKAYHKHRIGKPMGGVSVRGYRVLKIDGVHCAVGPLAIFYVTGKWPVEDVDHGDRDP